MEYFDESKMNPDFAEDRENIVWDFYKTYNLVLPFLGLKPDFRINKLWKEYLADSTIERLNLLMTKTEIDRQVINKFLKVYENIEVREIQEKVYEKGIVAISTQDLRMLT